jgi:uncharacterized membrane protein
MANPVKISDSTSTTSSTTAASSSAVKSAYDLANGSISDINVSGTVISYVKNNGTNTEVLLPYYRYYTKGSDVTSLKEIPDGIWYINNPSSYSDYPVTNHGLLISCKDFTSTPFQLYIADTSGHIFHRKCSVDAWTQMTGCVVVAVSAIADLSSKSNGSYSISSATLAGVSGAWIVDKRDSLYTATCTSDPRVVLNSVDLTNWYSPYAYWHA